MDMGRKSRYGWHAGDGGAPAAGGLRPGDVGMGLEKPVWLQCVGVTWVSKKRVRVRKPGRGG